MSFEISNAESIPVSLTKFNDDETFSEYLQHRFAADEDEVIIIDSDSDEEEPLQIVFADEEMAMNQLTITELLDDEADNLDFEGLIDAAQALKTDLNDNEPSPLMEYKHDASGYLGDSNDTPTIDVEQPENTSSDLQAELPGELQDSNLYDTQQNSNSYDTRQNDQILGMPVLIRQYFTERYNLLTSDPSCGHVRCISVPVTIRIAIADFIESSNTNAQKEYVWGCVTKRFPNRKMIRNSYNYALYWGMFVQFVCKRMFCDTTGIDPGLMREWVLSKPVAAAD